MSWPEQPHQEGRPGKRLSRRSSILKSSRPLSNDMHMNDDKIPLDKRRVSFSDNVMVKFCGKAKKDDSSDSYTSSSPSVYMMPANQESLVQISTPVGAKKRRLTGSTFLKKERLSFIPQNLDFEPYIEESPASLSITNKENITLQDNPIPGPVIVPHDMSLEPTEPFSFHTIVTDVALPPSHVEQPTLEPMGTIQQPALEPVGTVTHPALEPVGTVTQPALEPVETIQQPVLEPVGTIQQPALGVEQSPLIHSVHYKEQQSDVKVNDTLIPCSPDADDRANIYAVMDTPKRSPNSSPLSHQPSYKTINDSLSSLHSCSDGDVNPVMASHNKSLMVYNQAEESATLYGGDMSMTYESIDPSFNTSAIAAVTTRGNDTKSQPTGEETSQDPNTTVPIVAANDNDSSKSGIQPIMYGGDMSIILQDLNITVPTVVANNNDSSKSVIQPIMYGGNMSIISQDLNTTVPTVAANDNDSSKSVTIQPTMYGGDMSIISQDLNTTVPTVAANNNDSSKPVIQPTMYGGDMSITCDSLLNTTVPNQEGESNDKKDTTKCGDKVTHSQEEPITVDTVSKSMNCSASNISMIQSNNQQEWEQIIQNSLQKSMTQRSLKRPKVPVAAVSTKLRSLTPLSSRLRPGIKSPYLPDYTGPNSYVTQLTNSRKKKSKNSIIVTESVVQEKKVTDDCIIETGQEEQDVETSGDQENNRTFLIQDPIAEEDITPTDSPSQQSSDNPNLNTTVVLEFNKHGDWLTTNDDTSMSLVEEESPLATPIINPSTPLMRPSKIPRLTPKAKSTTPKITLKKKQVTEATPTMSLCNKEATPTMNLETTPSMNLRSKKATSIINKEDTPTQSNETTPTMTLRSKGTTPTTTPSSHRKQKTPLTRSTKTSKVVTPLATTYRKVTPKQIKVLDDDETNNYDSRRLTRKETASHSSHRSPLPTLPSSKIPKLTPVRTGRSKAMLQHIGVALSTLEHSMPDPQSIVNTPDIHTPKISILDDTLNQTILPPPQLDDTNYSFVVQKEKTKKEVFQNVLFSSDADKTLRLDEEYEKQEEEKKRQLEEEKKRQLEEQERQRQQEEERRRLEEEERKQQEEEERHKQEELERNRQEEEERCRLEEEERKRREEEERHRLEELERKRQQEEEEKKKQEEMEQRLLEEKLAKEEAMKNKDVSLADCLEIAHKKFETVFTAICCRYTPEYTCAGKQDWAHTDLVNYMTHVHSITYTCICTVRCMIDYVKMYDLPDYPSTLSHECANIPSLPDNDNDKKGSHEDKYDWAQVMLHMLSFLMHQLLQKASKVYKGYYNFHIREWRKELVTIDILDKIKVFLKLSTEGTSVGSGIASQKITDISWKPLQDGVSLESLLSIRGKSIVDIPQIIHVLCEKIK